MTFGSEGNHCRAAWYLKGEIVAIHRARSDDGAAREWISLSLSLDKLPPEIATDVLARSLLRIEEKR